MSDPIETPENTLKEGEAHPSAHNAFVWLLEFMAREPIAYVQIRESLASTALSGNRVASICSHTLDRLEKNQPVSDRYLLGVAWFIRDMIERKIYEDNQKQTSESSGSDGKGTPTDKGPKVDPSKGQKRTDKNGAVPHANGVQTGKRGKK